ncbi:carboxypeptidase regulatory-like domain-containing protein [Georgenia wutianyii]|uniref:Carboxypeptidase regulatory-like domain-containing protein n=1 Tax=Georgenia wutianyii TaxID=2585135 RepID=A0ABX5VN80_9MICO|nr:carboxypeptidase-like regulatory domain-containing protein [Georgenia wutianyii]QDB79136.1 carboxypeptidase regulatory-like domain-containing protein [Georgenia wutianyii]
MRALSTTDVLRVQPGETGEVPVDVVNTGAVIDAISARVLGLPADHVTTSPPVLALFPDATGRIDVRITVPDTFPAGTHPVTVEVDGQAPGSVPAHHDLDVVVGARPALSLAAVPSAVRAGRRAGFELAVRNTGNVPLDVALRATDTDRSVESRITPSAVHVEPGAVAACAVQVRGPRHLLGSDVERPLRVTATAEGVEQHVALTFTQRPAVGRGLLTALVLLGIIAVWAGIFLLGILGMLGTDPMTRTAPASFFAATGQDGAGGSDAPAGAVAKDGLLPAGVGGSLTGTVVGDTDGVGLGRITTEAWRHGRDGLVLVGSAATQADGSFEIAGLFPGGYLLRVAADGYDEVWYPAAPDAAGADTVTAEAQTLTGGLDVALVGHPGEIAGTVDVGDTTQPVETTVRAVATWTEQGEEVVVETTAGPDGAYVLPRLPAPGTYELTFTAEGYAPTTITERITGGQQRFAQHVRLAAGAGQISGTVTDGVLPLGGVTVRTTVADAEVVVGTPTVGQVGTFVVPGLPTPGTYVLTFDLEGYTSASAVVDLTAGQSHTDLAVVLRGGAGTVTGRVTLPTGAGLGGVAVTAGGAETTLAATTLTAGDVGSFTLSGLAPGTYTLTFTHPGYRSVSVPVDLTDGPPAPVAVTLHPATGRIEGIVTDGGRGAVGVDVTATDGRTTRTTTTTTRPPSSPGGANTPGYYLFADLPAGTYTVSVAIDGRVESTGVVRVTAGATASRNLALAGG